MRLVDFCIWKKIKLFNRVSSFTCEISGCYYIHNDFSKYKDGKVASVHYFY